MSQHNRILIADDEASLRTVLATSLRKDGFEVATAKNGEEALELLRSSQSPYTGEPFDALIADLKMPQMDGMTLLDHATKEFEDLPVIMLTAHGTVDTAVKALKRGAFDFLTKPYERDEVLMVVKKAIAQRAKNASSALTQPDSTGTNALVGRSEQMQKLHEIIERIADTPSTVLITGESGTGKELVAQALHQKSGRKDQPFIRINCAAIPENLLESELFGYEKGAFTGAVTSKPGRFELADGGTLFLDEIGELSIELQVKLLRALQESTFERVGGIKTIKMDARLVAATNRDLEKAITEERFREDLFYRLNVVPLSLPPLRERKEDISGLVEHFVRKYNARLSRRIERFSPSALKVLEAYNWPGNIRELENIVERTILFSDSLVVEDKDLPIEILRKAQSDSVSIIHANLNTLDSDASMKDIVRKATAEIERDFIARALEETRGNVTHAARKLKISRKSLQMKMKDLGLRDDCSL